MNLETVLKNIEFKSLKRCNLFEIRIIRQIRNEDKIRKKMKNQHKISISEHSLWYNKVKFSKTNFFYTINYQDKLIGGLGLNNFNKNSMCGEWAYYISNKKNFIGLGASIEYKAIEFLFKIFRLNELYCYVLGNNLEISRLHKKFGFKEISFTNYSQKKFSNKQILNAVYLVLKKSKWKNTRKQIYKKYFSDNEK